MIAKIIRILCLALLVGVFCVSCSSTEEETQIEDVIKDFYKYLNEGDIKRMNTLFSANMQRDSRKNKTLATQFIKIKKIYIKDIDINTITSRVSVECTDEFNNTTEQNWDLIKEKDDWKINNFNFSKTSPLNADKKTQNAVKDTVKVNSDVLDTTYTDTINNAQTLQQ